MKSLIFFLFVTLFSSVNISAQTTYDTIKSTVIIFENDSSSTTHVSSSVRTSNSNSKKKRSFAKNNIKVGLFGAAYGQVPIYYERYIKDWLTIQAGLGLATRDFIGDLYLNRGIFTHRNEVNTTWNGSNEVDVSDDYSSYQYRKAGIGIYASIAPRFFVASDAFDGFYLSPVFEYALRNYKVQKVDVNGERFSNDKMKEKMSNIYFSLNLGWQNNFVPVTLDWSWNVGLWYYKATRQDIGYTENGSGGIFGNREVTFSHIRPYFKLNLDIGVALGKKIAKTK